LALVFDFSAITWIINVMTCDINAKTLIGPTGEPEWINLLALLENHGRIGPNVSGSFFLEFLSTDELKQTSISAGTVAYLL